MRPSVGTQLTGEFPSLLKQASGGADGNIRLYSHPLSSSASPPEETTLPAFAAGPSRGKSKPARGCGMSVFDIFGPAFESQGDFVSALAFCPKSGALYLGSNQGSGHSALVSSP